MEVEFIPARLLAFLQSLSNVASEFYVEETYSAEFSLNAMLRFAASHALSPTVRLNLATDVPFFMEYLMEGGHARFYLAPRLNDDDFDSIPHA